MKNILPLIATITALLFTSARAATISSDVGGTAPAPSNDLDNATDLTPSTNDRTAMDHATAGTPDRLQEPLFYHWSGCKFEDLHPALFTVPPITRPHPRILVTPEEVTAIKVDIAGKVQPRLSAWEHLQSQAQLDLKEKIAPPYTGNDTLSYYSHALLPMRRATELSLAWLVDGTPTYAAKAKEILLTWARATPLPGANPSIDYRFPNAGMDVTRGTIGFIYAYDALYNDLSPAERSDVEAWFRSLLPVIYTGIKRWDTAWETWPEAKVNHNWVVSRDTNTPAYFGGQFYQNHLVAHALGLLTIGYAVGDRGLVQFAVDSRENPRDLIELINGMILMKDKPLFLKNDTAPHQDGEMADRYRHGEHKGLGYCMLSFDEMLVMTETLHRNGLNLYDYVGAHGETMEKPFTFYADFVRLKDSSIKGGYYSGEKVSGDSARYEIGNLRYPGNPDIEALLRSVDRTASVKSGLLGCPNLIYGRPLAILH